MAWWATIDWGLLVLVTILATGHYLCRELSEHSMHDKWPQHYSDWWNSDTGSVNKHNWGKSLPGWVFKDLLVFTTDAEHFFQWLSNIFMLGIIWCVFGPEQWWLFIGLFLGLGITYIIKKLTPLQ